MFALADPGREARGEVALCRPAGSSQEFLEIAQPAIAGVLVVVALNRRGDGLFLLGRQGLAGLADQPCDPGPQERPVAGRARQLQRVEPGGLSGTQRGVVAADGAQEQLGAAILVEEDGARLQLLGLGGQEVQHHHLARAGRADDREIAEVGPVEVEEVGGGGGSLHDRDRRTPAIALGLADREAMQRGEAGIGAGGDQGLAGDEGFVARKLGPEGGLQVQVLAHGHRAEVGQGRDALGGRLVQLRQGGGADQQGQVVLAQGGTARVQVVLGLGQATAQGLAVVVGRPQAPQGQRDALGPDLAVDEGEAL